jgi:hypothetical protein
MPTLLLCATTTGYQLDSFRAAARRLGVDTRLATDRCHVMDDPWGDQAVPMQQPEDILPADGVVALGEKAARFAARLGWRFHSAEAVEAACDKRLTRKAFRRAGLRTPAPDGFPCVVKPVARSASQGVIRANDETELAAAIARVKRLVGTEELLVERFIPGHEYAIEGLVTGGRLHVVAMFDKPDPLDGPFFEETIYVTMEPLPEAVAETQRAVSALGLSDGPIHAEMRINPEGVWMLEVAARPIGGLCARVVPELEEAVIRHSLDGSAPTRPYVGPAGVMMIPVGIGGIFRGVSGIEAAMAVHGIEDVVITAKEGQLFRPWPEGNSYPGFLFARCQEPAAALRHAQACLQWDFTPELALGRAG